MAVEFFLDYAGFLAQTVTVVVAVLVILVAIAVLRSRSRHRGEGHLEVHRLNDFYKSLRESLEQIVLDKDRLKTRRKAEAKAEKRERKEGKTKPRLFVLDFDGDIRASATDKLRHEVTAVLSMAKPEDEVVLRLESGGRVGAQLWPGRFAIGPYPPGWCTPDRMRRQGGRQRRLHDGLHR